MNAEGRLLWRLFTGATGWLALAALLAVLAAFSSIGLVAAAGWLITASAVAGLAATGLEIFLPGAIVRALAVSRTLTRYGERLLSHESIFRVLARLRRAVFARLARLPLHKLARRRASRDNQRLIHDVERLEAWPVELLLPLVASISAAVLIIALFAWIAPLLLPVVSGLILMVLAGFAYLKQSAKPPAMRSALDRQRLGEEIQETLMAAESLWHCDAQQRQLSRCLRLQQRLLERESKLQRRALQLDACVPALISAGVLALLALASHGLGTIDAAWHVLLMLALLAFAGLLSGLATPVWQWAGVWVSARRLLAEPAQAPADDRRPACSGPPALRLRNINVPRGVADQPVFSDFDLRIGIGEWWLVQGASGSGKSTLLRLFTGLQQATKGEVLIDGQAISRDDGVRLSRIAVLTQETVILEDTLRNNLLLSPSNEISDAQLEDALQGVGLDELCGQLERWIGASGQPLSGGQARRVALLRTCLSGAPGLILDEPFRGLDADSQRLVRRWLWQVCRGRTLLLLDHRAPSDWPGQRLELSR